MERYLGIDPSLVACGVAVVPHVDSGEISQTWVLKPPKGLSVPAKRLARLEWFMDEMSGILNAVGPDAVGIEGYSYGSVGRREAVGELGAVLRLEVWFRGIPFLLVPPRTLKKFVGSGKLGKSSVVKEVYKRYGVDTNSDNEADAFVLAVMARSYEDEDSSKYLYVYQQECLRNMERFCREEPRGSQKLEPGSK